MIKEYCLNEKKYGLIENYKDGFDEQEVRNKLTDYFDEYDYIIGDWSYGKLRLKGFCSKGNSLYKPMNDFKRKEDYLKEYCAYECRYFILKHIK